MSDTTPAPWEHRKTPLARSFDSALDRVSAIGAGGDTTAATVSRQALLVSGLDVNAAELDLYIEAITAAYIAQAADEGASDARAVMLMRGLATTCWLAGRLPGVAPARSGSPLAAPEDVAQLHGTPTVAERHRADRIALYERQKAERLVELGDDQGGDGALNFGMPLRAVLELEAARLEGMAAEIGRWMPGPLWELFDGAARELRDLLAGS